MANITFIIKTSPNTNPKEKKVGGHGILYPPPEKVGGHVPCIPHQIAPMRLIVTLVQITNYTSPNYTDRPQVNIHCIENFFTVHDFWATCACLEKTELPWNFSLYWIYVSYWGFWQLALALKTEFPLKFFTVLNIFFTIQDFWATCAWPEKQSCPDIFTVLNVYFLLFRSFE